MYVIFIMMIKKKTQHKNMQFSHPQKCKIHVQHNIKTKKAVLADMNSWKLAKSRSYSLMPSVDCTRSIVNIYCAVLQHPKGRSHWKIACSLFLVLPVERLLWISTRKDMWNLMMLWGCALIHPQRSVLGSFLYYLLRSVCFKKSTCPCNS